jgi:hypothetical protein
MSALSIQREPGDELAGGEPVGRAIERLAAAVEAKETAVRVLDREAAIDGSWPTVLVSGPASPSARRIFSSRGISPPRAPEGVVLIPDRSGDRWDTLASGSDERGMVYAVLELADRVEHGGDPLEAVRIEDPIVERPANAVRSVARCFASETDDKPWFHEEGFWRRYLSMVVSQRFNRVNFMVGLGYNFPWHIKDGYLLFAYPFLVDVPGYRVRVPELPTEERERNLAMLRFASDEAAALGLDFQLGLWTHAYEWIDSPDARHTVDGLDPDHHAPYCRDALRMLLEACPSIGGVTLRTHGESGIPERSWDFWRTVLEGVATSGRPVGIDMHAKGLDRRTLDIALASGLPVTVSPKYSAEHMGLPYHQTAIREMERLPVSGESPTTGKGRFMTVSEGTRPFTRYGYGDLLREDRSYDVVFRIWPGTQRFLLWGDPAMAAGFGRHAHIAGTQGLEWCEPLSLKGREGTSLGPRDGYTDRTFAHADDWEKYAYTFRLFGRLTYDPDSDPETWRRFMRTTFGEAAAPAEAALASASRILPLVTMAHHPSASNNYYWPEIYTDIGIVGGADGSVETDYYDTPIPKRFGTVRSLDPEVFPSVEESVLEAVGGRASGRVSADQVASWLERLCLDVARGLARIDTDGGAPWTEAVRRLVVDVGIQAALGRFFAGKLRAALRYEIATRTANRRVLLDALEAYRAARAAFAEAAGLASGVYVEDLTYGPQPWLRGTWSDRLPAIDRDIDEMAGLAATIVGTELSVEAERVLESLRGAPRLTVSHTPPAWFRAGEPVFLTVEIDPAHPSHVESVHLRYRHVNHAEAYTEVEMAREADSFSAVIPGGYSDSPFALQYLVVVRFASGGAFRHPGLGPELSDQPYFLVRQKAHSRSEPGVR